MKRWLAVLAGLAMLTGCAPADPGSYETRSVGGASASPAPSIVRTAARPTWIELPSISAKGPLDEVSVDAKTGKMQELDLNKPERGAWFKYSPVPGDAGPSVVVAHVDGHKKPGLFFRLKAIKPGDSVYINLTNGTRAEFRVDRVAQYNKAQFPTEKVYGETADSQLRLITCTGDFVGGPTGYEDNLVAFATLLRLGEGDGSPG